MPLPQYGRSSILEEARETYQHIVVIGAAQGYIGGIKRHLGWLSRHREAIRFGCTFANLIICIASMGFHSLALIHCLTISGSMARYGGSRINIYYR